LLDTHIFKGHTTQLHGQCVQWIIRYINVQKIIPHTATRLECPFLEFVSFQGTSNSVQLLTETITLSRNRVSVYAFLYRCRITELHANVIAHAHSRHGNINPFPFLQTQLYKERLTLRQLLLLRNPYPLGQQGFHLSLLLLPSRSVPDHCSTRIHIQASTPQCPQHAPTCLTIKF